MSLRFRLVMAGALAVVLALALAALGLSSLFGRHVEQRSLSELSANLDQVLAGLDTSAQGLAILKSPADPRFEQPYSGLYWQIDTPTQSLRSRSLWDATLRLPVAPGGSGTAQTYHLAGPNGQSLLAMARQIILPERLGHQKILAIAAIDEADLIKMRHAFVSDMLPYLVLLAVVLVVAGWFQVTVGLQPLAHLGDKVGELQSDPNQRMGSGWPKEVGVLAGKVDILLDTRASDLERARMRAADLAHGLKTPLQALIGEAEELRGAGLAGIAEGIEDIVDSMRKTVDRELARAFRQYRKTSVRVSPSEVVAGIVAVVQKTPDGKRVAWHIDVPRSHCVTLNSGDLADALGALIENAARHAKTKVTIGGHTAADQVVLSICDDGPGIPTDQRATMLSRFVRADEGGSGLGLAIAHEIITSAGGEITLEDAGPGLKILLRLTAGKAAKAFQEYPPDRPRRSS